MTTTPTDDDLLTQLRAWADDPAQSVLLPSTIKPTPNYALALTALGEARGDDADGSSVEERIAVMCVVRNRVKRGSLGWGGVIFKAEQFSCWNPGEANRAWLLSLWRRLIAGEEMLIAPAVLAIWRETNALAVLVTNGTILDHTGGATSYYAPAAMKPIGRVPSWAIGKPYRLIGTQRFLNV